MSTEYCKESREQALPGQVAEPPDRMRCNERFNGSSKSGDTENSQSRRLAPRNHHVHVSYPDIPARSAFISHVQ